MTQHTPAPWEVEKYDVAGITHSYRVRMSNGYCATTSALDPDTESNVFLIAASPELLDALITALPYVEMAEHDETYKKGEVKKVVNQIRAVIAKAEGKAP